MDGMEQLALVIGVSAVLLFVAAQLGTRVEKAPPSRLSLRQVPQWLGILMSGVGAGGLLTWLASSAPTVHEIAPHLDLHVWTSNTRPSWIFPFVMVLFVLVGLPIAIWVKRERTQELHDKFDAAFGPQGGGGSGGAGTAGVPPPHGPQGAGGDTGQAGVRVSAGPAGALIIGNAPASVSAVAPPHQTDQDAGDEGS